MVITFRAKRNFKVLFSDSEREKAYIFPISCAKNIKIKKKFYYVIKVIKWLPWSIFLVLLRVIRFWYFSKMSR